MIDITELAQRMKAAAVRAKAATEDYVAHRMSITVCLEECKEFNDLSDGPDNVLALVEALELKEEQRANWFQMAQKLGEDLDAAEKRIAELERQNSVLADGVIRAEQWLLESRTVTVKLPDYRNTYKGPFADEVEHQVRLALELFSSTAGIKVEAE